MTENSSDTSRVAGQISVIIPAYNQEPYITDALDSLSAQQLGKFTLEVIVVNDASTDLTATLVSEYAEHFPELKLITHPVNRGVSAARNSGLAEATGQYIAFLDPDDWFAKDHLARLAQDLEELDVAFVRCDHVQVKGAARQIHRAPQAQRHVARDPRNDILPVDASSMIDYPFPPTGLFRHDVLPAPWFDESLHTCEDRLWMWQLFLSGQRYAVVGEPGFFYRRGNSDSLTQVFDERQLHFVRAYSKIVSLVFADPASEDFLPKALRQFFAVSCHHLNRSKQFAPAMAARLRQEITEALAAMPQQHLARALHQLDGRRRAMLLSLHKPTVGKVRS
ncbi:glycosyltransferase family 2 protein [Glutamicibacter uratoxydans]|uniref:glycosyltransferase family 2 protein n=1 Tax=Glutamicibacter uratoxydans TaxID=43667 RepID=UPI003D6DB7FD